MGYGFRHTQPREEFTGGTPPPVIADVALEEALKAIHKCTDAFHVFMISRLFTPAWICLFHIISDFIVKRPLT